MKIHKISLLLLVNLSVSWGQFSSFKFRREINNTQDGWGRVEIPLDVYAKCKDNLADLRILGVNSKNDSTETPYVLKTLCGNWYEKSVGFELINSVKSRDGYSVTIVTDKPSIINQISLDFLQNNYDWKVNLYGSDENKDWELITENYRIVSLSTDNEEYAFNTLYFSKTKYKYYKILVKTQSPCLLKNAFLKIKENKDLEYENVVVKKIIQNDNTKEKISIVDFELQYDTPLSYIKLFAQSSNDNYYRDFKLEYLTDSVLVNNKWIYNYVPLTSEQIISSIQSNEYLLPGKIVKRLRLTIFNNDNEPLKITQIQTKICKKILLAKFKNQTKYSVFYGKSQINEPNYDLLKFADNIPSEIPNYQLANEEAQFFESTNQESPKIDFSKWWLWIVMLLISLALGFGAYKMLKETKK
ncbi:MAG: DUF3999 family protein [Cytophagales bacterium]